jgi:hypothetical protein
MTMDMHPILALWAHPRSLSTVVERIFIERGDFEVMHEPFSVVYYLHEQRAPAVQTNLIPGEAADYGSVRNQIVQAAHRRPVCFKDMCYHCHDHLIDDEPFLGRLTNVFLIRDPRQTIASHYAKNPGVTNDEIGYEQQAAVFRRVAKLTGDWPPVVAAEDLQQDPDGVLATLCHRLGIDDCPDALSWQVREPKQWTGWRQWHREVAQSTGIQAHQTVYPDTVDNHPRLARFYRHHRPFHDELYRHRLVART